MINKIIASDFDDSLVIWDYQQTGWGGLRLCGFRYNENLINELLEYQRQGYIIHVITFRGLNISHISGEDGVEEILQRAEEKYGLKITSVIYTDSKCKVPFMKELGISCFYDDNEDVICSMVQKAPEIRPVFIKHNCIMSENPRLEEYINLGKVEVMEIG